MSFFRIIHFRKQAFSWLGMLGLCVGLLMQIAAGFHHHDDFDEHDDCPICEFAQAPAATPDLPLVILVVMALVGLVFIVPQGIPSETSPELIRVRGPPLL